MGNTVLQPNDANIEGDSDIDQDQFRDGHGPRNQMNHGYLAVVDGDYYEDYDEDLANHTFTSQREVSHTGVIGVSQHQTKLGKTDMYNRFNVKPQMNSKPMPSRGSTDNMLHMVIQSNQ